MTIQRNPNIGSTVIVSDRDAPFLNIPPLVADPAPGPNGPDGPDGPQGDPAFGAFEQDYVASPGQTAFVLPATPVFPNLTVMIVDHLLYYPNLDFTISGNTVTWLGAPTTFNLIGGEDIRIYFS